LVAPEPRHLLFDERLILRGVLLKDRFDAAEFFVPTTDDMPLALTDGKTVGIVFGIGYRT